MAKGRFFEQGDYEEVINKLQAGQPVYLENFLQDIAIKIEPGNPDFYTAKHKDGSYYQLRYDTNLACETLLEANQLTEDEFLRY
jgi:hypothetical protein